MRYFFVGFTPVLSKASTFNVPVSWLFPAEESLCEPSSSPQPCAANTAMSTSTAMASKSRDPPNRRFPITMCAPRSRTLMPGVSSHGMLTEIPCTSSPLVPPLDPPGASVIRRSRELLDRHLAAPRAHKGDAIALVPDARATLGHVRPRLDHCPGVIEKAGLVQRTALEVEMYQLDDR